MPTQPADPHQDQPVLEAGPPLDEAQAAVVLLHGRGASARGMLRLADELDASSTAYRAPQAARRTWYPQSFMAPLDENEPELGSALRTVDAVLRTIADGGVSADRSILLGFSQGACLATEYAARTPRRYGGVVALSGGLIGPEAAQRQYEGSLDGTPVFLGCSDRDPYIPEERVHRTADVLGDMGADVTTRIYKGMGHTTNRDEIEHVRSLLDRTMRASEARGGDLS